MTAGGWNPLFGRTRGYCHNSGGENHPFIPLLRHVRSQRVLYSIYVADTLLPVRDCLGDSLLSGGAACWLGEEERFKVIVTDRPSNQFQSGVRFNERIGFAAVLPLPGKSL